MYNYGFSGVVVVCPLEACEIVGVIRYWGKPKTIKLVFTALLTTQH